MREPELRLDLDTLQALFDRLVVLPCDPERLSEIGLRDQRQRIELLGPPQLRECFVVPAPIEKRLAVPLVTGRIIRIQRDRPFEFVLRFRPVPLEFVLDQSE